MKYYHKNLEGSHSVILALKWSRREYEVWYPVGSVRAGTSSGLFITVSSEYTALGLVLHKNVLNILDNLIWPHGEKL